MLTLQFYTRPDCELCDSALAVVKRVQRRVPFQIDEINIDGSSQLRERYGSVIPVVTCGDIELACSFVDEKVLLESVQKLSHPT